jgi:hypothetical protein
MCLQWFPVESGWVQALHMNHILDFDFEFSLFN